MSKLIEKSIRIQLPGDKYLPAILCGNFKRPIILMVHGLTGHMNEHIFFNGARYFDKHGFSSLRVNLYSNSEDNRTRCLTDCTLKTHAEDINRALQYLRRHGARKIHAVGHSFGGPSIMLADQNLIDGYVLWDSSYEPNFIKSFGAKPLSRRLMKINWGVGFIVGRKMKDFSEKLDWDEMARKIKKPLLAIYAGKGILKNTAQTYTNLFKGPSELVGIPGATHCFDEPGTEEKLFTETLKWLKKQI
ncbi:MAG: alpha/beta fold hydrolase [Patescibacteria group bacterium]